MFFDGNYMLWVLLPTLIISGYAQWKVRSAYAHWSRVPNARGASGIATAQAIMRHAGLDHVGIDRVAGELTDHYDPRTKSIHLSESSTQPSIAAMAIVAHELGHAEQDHTGDAMLRLRGSLVPVASLGSNLGVWLILGGFFLAGMNQFFINLAWLGVMLFAVAVAFTLVTLPVEFDASRRAKRFLTELDLVTPNEARGVSAVLDAAALTYVAAAAGAVLQLLYWISVLNRRR